MILVQTQNLKGFNNSQFDRNKTISKRKSISMERSSRKAVSNNTKSIPTDRNCRPISNHCRLSNIWKSSRRWSLSPRTMTKHSANLYPRKIKNSKTRQDWMKRMIQTNCMKKTLISPLQPTSGSSIRMSYHGPLLSRNYRSVVKRSISPNP